MTIYDDIEKNLDEASGFLKGGPGSGPRPHGGSAEGDQKATTVGDSLREAHGKQLEQAKEQVKSATSATEKARAEGAVAAHRFVGSVLQSAPTTGRALSQVQSRMSTVTEKIRAGENKAHNEGQRSALKDAEKLLSRGGTKMDKLDTVDVGKGGPGSGPRPGQGRHPSGREDNGPSHGRAEREIQDMKISDKDIKGAFNNKDFYVDARANHAGKFAGDFAAGFKSGKEEASTIVGNSKNLDKTVDSIAVRRDRARADYDDRKGDRDRDEARAAGKLHALRQAATIAGKHLSSEDKSEKTEAKKYDQGQLAVIKACTPASGETEEKFVSRCIGEMVGEGRDQDQAAAICYSKWSGKVDKANSRTIIMSPEPDEDESDFMDRCVAYHTGRGDPEDNAERVCSTMWDNKADTGMDVEIQGESSLSAGFMDVKRP